MRIRIIIKNYVALTFACALFWFNLEITLPNKIYTYGEKGENNIGSW